MKKLFTLLTLLLCMGGAWGADFVTYSSESSGPTFPMNIGGVSLKENGDFNVKNQTNSSSEISSEAGLPSTKIYVISFKGGAMLDIDAGSSNKITSITIFAARNSSGNTVSQFGHGGFSNDQTTWSEISDLSAKGYDYGSKITITPTGDYRYYSFGRGKLGSTSPSTNVEARIYKVIVTYEAVAAAPSAIVFDPASGTEQEGGTEVDITSTGATTILYQWGSSAVDGEGDWTGATTYGEDTKPEVPAYGSSNNVLSVKASNAYGDTYGSATYTIVAAKKDLTLNYSGNVTLKANETLVPAVLSASDDEGAVNIEDIIDDIEFTTSDATIATVTDAGVVAKTGKVGTATITATFAGNSTYRPTSASYTITVQTVPITYQTVDLTLGHTWDFSIAAAEEADLIADIENWGLVSSTEHRYTNKNALSTARMVANYEELVWTEGLYFTGKAEAFRLNMNSDPCNLQLNGSNLDVTIKGLKAGQVISVVAKSANTDNTDRYIKAQTNITIVSGFADPETADWTTSVGTVTADGDIVLRSSAGINIKSITLGAATATVSVGTSGFATYCNSDYALDFTDKSIQAYTISSTDGQTLTLTKKDKVAKGEPVLLYNASGSASENIPAIAESEATKDNDNKLKQGTGSALTWAETTAEYYVLVVSEGYTPGFYRANNNTVAATRAYLDLTGLPATARSFSLNFNDQEPTGIGATLNDEITNNNFYDLQGRRVAQPQRGLYIMNGRKVVVR